MTATGAPEQRTPELTRIAGFAVLGLLAGIAAKAADESGWRWAADLGSYPAAWVLVVALIVRSAPTVAGRAAGFFAAMVHWATRTPVSCPEPSSRSRPGPRWPGARSPGPWSALTGGPASEHPVQGVVDAVVALVLQAVLPVRPVPDCGRSSW